VESFCLIRSGKEISKLDNYLFLWEAYYLFVKKLIPFKYIESIDPLNCQLCRVQMSLHVILIDNQKPLKFRVNFVDQFWLQHGTIIFIVKLLNKF